MRIGFLFTQTFWGVVLILFGISAILRSFNINVPFFRIFIALLFIYFGISLMVGGPTFHHSYRDGSTAVFSNIKITAQDITEDEFSIIFGSGELDLRNMEADQIRNIEVNVIFGSGTLILDQEQLAEIQVSSAFGSAKMPDGNNISFGEYTYRSPVLETNDRPNFIIDGSVVFGELTVVER